MILRSCVLSLVLAVTGCATGSGRIHKDLPSREVLDGVIAQPAPEVKFQAAEVGASEWALAGPFPERLENGEHPRQSGWDEALISQLAAKAPSVRAAGNMHCAAREVARYAAEKGGLPQQMLVDFMFARCGATFGGRLYWSVGKLPEGASDAALTEAWNGAVGAAVDNVVSAGAEVAGISFASKDDRAVLVVAFGKPSAELEPLSILPAAGGAFTVRGTLREPAEDVYAEINKGEFGYADCERDHAVPLPGFAFSCPSQSTDALAWIQVSVRPPKRLLGHSVARLLVSPSGAPTANYVHPRYDGLQNGASFAERFLTRINEVRARAGMKQLTLAPKQSETAVRLAPHYFAAVQQETKNPKAADVIALGMMAGWDVGGEQMIRFGTFASHWVFGSSDVGDLVAAMLTYPSGRAGLLNSDARSVAVGQLLAPDGSSVAALTSTYLYLEEAPQQEDAAKVIQQLNVRRAALGLEPAVWAAGPSDAESGAVAMLQQGADLQGATDYLLQKVAEASQQPTRGWVLTTWDLDRVTFPDELVRAPKLAVVLAVGRYKAPGDPWGAYVIMMATPDMGSVKPIMALLGR